MTNTYVLIPCLLLGFCVVSGVMSPTVGAARKLKLQDDNSTQVEIIRKWSTDNGTPSYKFARTIMAKTSAASDQAKQVWHEGRKQRLDLGTTDATLCMWLGCIHHSKVQGDFQEQMFH
ncbi:hypothetical protein EG68_00550 [Paragonimus skrjabini miyazakii]|uniref:Uncharacterized protein n=1 Tax=Paragonimus skrjabini miyazakii TaxID=59628 RepID=A0A8S9Z3L9_9TREM|nr:hypothetical protein EG68_00550 [Paragonimus skrjabini miyazakii]